MFRKMRPARRMPLVLLLILFATNVTALAEGHTEPTFSLTVPATFIRADLATSSDFTAETEAVVTVESIAITYGNGRREHLSRDALGLSLPVDSGASILQSTVAGGGETIQLPIAASGLEAVREFEVVLSVSPESAFDLAATAYEIPTAIFAAVGLPEEANAGETATDTSTATTVVLNELMADNDSLVADPQGDFDDWLELANISEADVDLSGMYLSDDEEDLRKWQFPPQTVILAGGYLVVWADD